MRVWRMKNKEEKEVNVQAEKFPVAQYLAGKFFKSGTSDITGKCVSDEQRPAIDVEAVWREYVKTHKTCNTCGAERETSEGTTLSYCAGIGNATIGDDGPICKNYFPTTRAAGKDYANIALLLENYDLPVSMDQMVEATGKTPKEIMWWLSNLVDWFCFTDIKFSHTKTGGFGDIDSIFTVSCAECHAVFEQKYSLPTKYDNRVVGWQFEQDAQDNGWDIQEHDGFSGKKWFCPKCKK